MTEIFTNINNDIKNKADIIWKLTLGQKNPVSASYFLNNIINYYRNKLTEEEINFLQFYIQMQMEMMKND